jgi:hypothetical protein
VPSDAERAQKVLALMRRLIDTVEPIVEEIKQILAATPTNDHEG